MQDAITINEVRKVGDEIRFQHDDGSALCVGFIVVVLAASRRFLPFFFTGFNGRAAGDIRPWMTRARTGGRVPKR
jgi:hypothetical protein